MVEVAAWLFRRRHSILGLFICGWAAFSCVMLYNSTSISIDGVEIRPDRQHTRKPTYISAVPNKDGNIGNVTKQGVMGRVSGLGEVQGWLKRTPDPINGGRQANKELNTAPILQVIQQEKAQSQKGLQRKQKMQSSMIEKLVPISSEVVPCSALNSECQRFRRLMADWPDGKPCAAFYFLTKSERLDELKRALRSVDDFFNDEFHYPIIIFHEAELVRNISIIRNFSRSNMFFQQIEFTVPDFLTEEIPEEIPCTSQIPYRHMCRFHAKGVFQQPIMRGLEYYWRLDDDSHILRNIPYDVFQFMRDQHLLYGYQWRYFDNEKCVAGLWNATYKYVADNGIKPEFLSEWRDPYIYYNNFEVTNTKLWLSKDYANYIEYLDRLGGIFFHRWGDAPIKGLAVAVLPKRSLITDGAFPSPLAYTRFFYFISASCGSISRSPPFMTTPSIY